MARENVLEGVFALNKPMGMSSAQVIRDCQTYFNPSNYFRPLIQQEVDKRARESNAAHRRRSRAKRDSRVKMGHGGTLDPLATGVLILGVGRGTKELDQFLHCKKTYETVVLFGASTDTYDRVGRILKKRPYDEITREAVEKALASFRGTFQQMPPLYSALKMNGKPLYEYAREGLSIPREIESRQVHVEELELVEWLEPGEHNHRWPVDEAGVAEQSLAERVWRKERDQAAGIRRSDEEEKSDQEALAAHEDFKRRAEAKQDELVYDRPAKRRRGGNNPYQHGGGVNERTGGGGGGGGAAKRHGDDLLMSGALGDLPSSSSSTPTGTGTGTSSATATATAPDNTNSTTTSTTTTKAIPFKPHGKGSNLVAPPPEPNTPPPWEGKGPPAARIRMTVSRGFYVRSFCHDLGEKLGSAALMAELARTKQGDFHAGTPSCLEYDDVLRGEAVWAPKLGRLLRLWKDGEMAKAGEEEVEGEAEEKEEEKKEKKEEKGDTEKKEEKEEEKEEKEDTEKKEDTEEKKDKEEKEEPEKKDKVDETEKEDTRSVAAESTAESEWNGFSDTAATPVAEKQ